MESKDAEWDALPEETRRLIEETLSASRDFEPSPRPQLTASTPFPEHGPTFVGKVDLPAGTTIKLVNGGMEREYKVKGYTLSHRKFPEPGQPAPTLAQAPDWYDFVLTTHD